MIKVLIVEDSQVAQEFLAHTIGSDPALQVVGIVVDGSAAVDAVRRHRPDVVTMDIHMPKLDGYEATRAIMEAVPTPIVVVSASGGAKEAGAVFRAIEAGALAVVMRPPGPGHPQHASAVREMLVTIKLMSEIKVVSRPARRKVAPPQAPIMRRESSGAAQVIAIGASTGGPPALQTILSGLPRDLTVPVLIVQHIASGFAGGFADWLGGASGFPVHVAHDGELALPGHAYVSPDAHHLGIDARRRIALSSEPADNGLRPSVAHLFRACARTFGAGTVAVLLTGMGRDGAAELLALMALGATTIAQDAASSVVHGMPGEAIRLGGVTHVRAPEEIAALLTKLVEGVTRGSHVIST